MMAEASKERLEELFAWIDDFPLSRPKRNINRDFADGVLTAEILHYYFPRLVDIHNYIPANGVNQKKANWETLNRKVLTRLKCPLPDTTVQQIVTGKAGAIESVLLGLKCVIEQVLLEPDYLLSSTSSTDLEIAPQTASSESNADKDNSMSARNAKKFSAATSERLKSLRYTAGEPMVPAILLEEQQQELLLSKESNQVLQAKVERLEEQVKLKDARIQDLTRRLENTALALNLNRGKPVPARSKQ